MRKSIRSTARWMVLLLLWSMLGNGVAVQAQAPGTAPSPAPAPRPPTIDASTVQVLQREGLKLNFEDIDIRTLARIISQITHRDIVLDQKVQGKVTVASARAVTPDEAWDIFVNALEAYGYGVESKNNGRFWVVSPIAQVRQKEMRLYPNRRARELVAVIQVERASADQLVNQVRPLLSPTGVVTAYPASNSLVVADEASIVRRVVLLVRRLDRATHKPVLRIYFLHHLRAREVAKNVEALMPERSQVKVTVHEPTNSLLVLALPEAQGYIRRLIESLERHEQITAEASEFYVYYLLHAQAEDVAKIIGQMLAERTRVEKQLTQAGVETAPVGGPTGETGPSAVPTPAAPVLPTEPSHAFPPGYGAQAGVPTRLEPAPFQSGAATLNPTGSYEGVGAAGAPTAQGGYASDKVAADKDTNSLIFYMPHSEYAVVKRLVEQLDIPQRQVLISAVIAEVDLTKMEQAGVNWQAVTRSGEIVAFGGGQSQTSLLGILSSGNFIFGGIDKATTTITANGQTTQVPNNFLLLQYLITHNDLDLISSPRLLTQDHKEANIKVGSIQPFATGTKFDINGQPIVNFDYREVGLDLKVTPHISVGETLNLEVHQKLQEVTSLQTQGVGAAQFSVPVVSNREVNTEVTLLDGQTLVIGGMVQKKTIRTIKKVPFLGDIPLLGDLLFKTKTNQTDKTTLFIFLTPHIIDSPQKLKEITSEYDHVLIPAMKRDKDAVDRQDYHPRKHAPAPVIEPLRQPTPGPAPTPEGSRAWRLQPAAAPSGTRGAPPTPDQTPRPPRTDRGVRRQPPGPTRPD